MLACLFIFFCLLTCGVNGWKDCVRPPVSVDADDPHDRGETYLDSPVPPLIMVDGRNKVAMDWHEKGGCTESVVMFMHHMGAVYGEDYSGFPHGFRKTFQAHCGHGRAALFKSKDWYRFTMVRNPYTRAVSSFVWGARYPTNIKLTRAQGDLLTFETFLSFLEGLTESQMYHAWTGSTHFGYQHRRYERAAMGNSSVKPYHAVVHIEDGQAGLDVVNKHFHKEIQAGMRPFVYTDMFNDTRKARKVDNVTFFVGNLPWHTLQYSIPNNYSLFYTRESQRRVAQLFAVDIALYNYSFPF